MKKRAFTLIELLVVIAVIAVLMSILMPSLNLAREQARSVACASNLKSMVLGWRLYAGSNDDKIVNCAPIRLGDRTSNQENRENPSWVFLPDNYQSGTTIEEEKVAIRAGAMWNFVKEVKVYRCPSDKRNKSGAFNNTAFRSYARFDTGKN